MYATAAWANKNQAASGELATKYTKIVVAPNMKRTIFADKIDPGLHAAADRRLGRNQRARQNVPGQDLVAPEAL